jgi:hypothetical protein
MADGLTADTRAGARPQLFEIGEPGVPVGDKKIMLRAVRRAEINQLVEIVSNTGFAQHGVGDQRSAHAADR